MVLNGIRDVNELKRLLGLGQISQDDLNNASLSGSLGPDQNALAGMLQQAQQPQQQAPQDPPEGSNFVRNDQTGHVTYITPQGLSDTPASPPGAGNAGPRMIAANAGPKQMNVVGSGNGSVVQLSPEDDKNVPLDYTRSPIDIPGVGRGYYGKDGNAYVTQNGQKTKVILGYDQQGSMELNKANQDMRKGESEIAATNERIRASQVQNPAMNMGAGGGGPVGTGDDFLKSLDPGTAGLVKAYADGRMAFPGGAAMRSPRMMQLLSLVSQYDPSFDATDFNARNKTMAGFTAGKQGDAVRAVNQAIAHAGSLSDAIDKLDNFGGMATPLNKIVNPVEEAFGNSKQGNFRMNALALSAELRKVFAGGGGGSLSELQSWESGLPENASKDQQKAYLAKGLELLQGGIGALNDQYQRGMGPKSNVMNLVSPTAKSALDKLIGAGDPDSPEAKQPQGQGLPKVGEVRRGYKYRGGDPSSHLSWVPV